VPKVKRLKCLNGLRISFAATVDAAKEIFKPFNVFEP
jgi:hypothetical protein